jgi:hypothetical protein
VLEGQEKTLQPIDLQGISGFHADTPKDYESSALTD